jgi:uncharacterized protein YggE
MASGTITVHGRGSVWARPDRYHLSFVISRLDDTAESALDDVARRQAQLLDELAAEGVDPGAWSTSHLNLQEEREWDGAQQRMLHRGHRATATVELRHHDAGVAARLLSGIAPLAEVHGPTWYFSEQHPARLEACAGATRDARAKAEAYAGAAGLRLGALTQMSEQGVGLQPPQPMVALPRSANGGGQRGPELRLEPGVEQVTADVEVAFDLLPA